MIKYNFFALWVKLYRCTLTLSRRDRHLCLAKLCMFRSFLLHLTYYFQRQHAKGSPRCLKSRRFPATKNTCRQCFSVSFWQVDCSLWNKYTLETESSKYSQISIKMRSPCSNSFLSSGWKIPLYYFKNRPHSGINGNGRSSTFYLLKNHRSLYEQVWLSCHISNTCTTILGLQ